MSKITLSSRSREIDGDHFTDEEIALKIAVKCSGCGRCVALCPRHALTLTTERPDGFGRKHAVVDSGRCNVCGLCLAHCPLGALTLTRYP